MMIVLLIRNILYYYIWLKKLCIRYSCELCNSTRVSEDKNIGIVFNSDKLTV